MEETIILNNNYILITLNEKTDFQHNIIDIQKINKKIKYNNILIKIDFNNLKDVQFKKILHNYMKYIKFCKKKNIPIGKLVKNSVLVGYILNLDKNNQKQLDFIKAINAILYDVEKSKYEYIYDEVCNYLDEQFSKNNLCDFKDDVCIEKRNCKSINGCCHHFKHKRIGIFLPFEKLEECEYLKDKKCTAQCISCKLFTCDTLKKKNVKFKLDEILLIDVFFNTIQKYIIKTSVFTKKKIILSRLVKWKLFKF